MKAIIGKKLGMSRIFDDLGNVVPVTLIVAEKNIITHVKNDETDGYAATQIGMQEDKKINQPMRGHLSKTSTKTKTLKEFALQDLNVGDAIDLAQFEKGDKVTVRAMSKGKGFAGTVKRHNFHTGPKTHGSNNYRQPGSIGSMYPQRVIKGRRMAGHLGHDNVTVKNLVVADVNNDKMVIMLRGAVPGANKSTVYIWKK
jgi:large subunit ribosomal protein L3